MSVLPRLRAPANDGDILVVPPLAQTGELLDVNRGRQPSAEQMLLGRGWTELRRLARAELVEAAKRGAEHVSSPERDTPSKVEGPLFLAGHQPELFHPGVWVKNFALAGMACRHGGLAINLVVDNDTLKSASLRVPVPSTKALPRPHAVTIAFDRWLAEVPFEERRVADAGLFASFGDRVSEALAGWGYEPIIQSFWPDVCRHVATTGLIGESFATARRDLERRWGCHNLEVPLSIVCAGEGFAWFAGQLLNDLAALLTDL